MEKERAQIHNDFFGCPVVGPELEKCLFAVALVMATGIQRAIDATGDARSGGVVPVPGSNAPADDRTRPCPSHVHDPRRRPNNSMAGARGQPADVGVTWI